MLSTSKNGHKSDMNLPVNNENESDQVLSATELAEIWERRAHQLAQEPVKEAVGETIDLLVFRLNDERYGIEVANIREIYPLERLTPVPRTPNFVVGVFSARGRILSVIDLQAFLGLPSLDHNNQAKIIVVTNTDMDNFEVGILTDEVEDVVTLFENDIHSALPTNKDTSANYVKGVTSDLLELLDLNTLLKDKRLIVNDET